MSNVKGGDFTAYGYFADEDLRWEIIGFSLRQLYDDLRGPRQSIVASQGGAPFEVSSKNELVATTSKVNLDDSIYGNLFI